MGRWRLRSRLSLRISRRSHGATEARFRRRGLNRPLPGERRDPSSAHGTTEMPVWGPVFRVWEPPEALVKVVSFVESIQVK